jgi:hypothetical protein
MLRRGVAIATAFPLINLLAVAALPIDSAAKVIAAPIPIGQLPLDVGRLQCHH